MTTLKICVLDRTYWLTDIREVLLARTFSIPDGAKDSELDALIFTPETPAPKSYSFTSFEGQGVDRVGNVLVIQRREAGGPRDWEPETWIVPSGASFLMSDSGKTIDRL